MICKFSKMEEQNNVVEDKLKLLKEEYKKPEMTEEQFEKLKEKMKQAKIINKKGYRQIKKIGIALAAAIGIFIIMPNTSSVIAHAMEDIPLIGQFVHVVVFRDYKYETDRNIADIEVPEIKTGKLEADDETKKKLEHTTEEINNEIKEITDKLIKEFKSQLDDTQGFQDIIVKSDILTTTKDYFTLKLNCYQGAGSGYQWNYYYTIDLNTGERLKLKDIFKDGADYITLISENIKEQMKKQMSQDKDIYYWLDDEIEEWNFKTITDKTSFYLDDKDNLVISFDEGEVAPMYMGVIEFKIPADVLNSIRK